MLFLDRGKTPLGLIFDVLGPVDEPYYSVRVNSKQDILDKGIEVRMEVYCAPKTEYTSYIFISALKA